MITPTREKVVGLPSLVAMVGVVATDQVTKALAHHQALPNPETLLGIVRTGSVGTTLAATTGLLAVAVWVVVRQVAAGRCPGWLAGIPLAGAASNVIDRFLHGAVMDWLTIGGYVVNLANFAIVCGAAAVALTVRHHHAASRTDPRVP